MPNRAKCKGCGADIIWAKTKEGKSIPLDIVPKKRYIRGEGALEDGSVYVELRNVFVTHFETCEKADEFRRR